MVRIQSQTGCALCLQGLQVRVTLTEKNLQCPLQVHPLSPAAGLSNQRTIILSNGWRNDWGLDSTPFIPSWYYGLRFCKTWFMSAYLVTFLSTSVLFFRFLAKLPKMRRKCVYSFKLLYVRICLAEHLMAFFDNDDADVDNCLVIHLCKSALFLKESLARP